VALTKGGSQKTQLEQIPEVPTEIQRDRWDRPLIVPKDGGRPIAYTRASTLGKAIEDTYHLSKWQQRSVAYGLSRRPDLLALVASIATNEGADRGPLDELCEKAHEAARGDQGANVGTAIHKLSEREDAGEDLSYLPPELLDALAAYREQMRSFEVLATETFVACDAVQTAGTFDRVVRLLVDLQFRHPVRGNVVIPAGTVLIVDLKTGKAESAKYWGPTYGVQQAVYQGGDPYTASGRMTWEQLLGEGNVPSDEWAILLHIPSDSPQDAGLIVVDLAIGREMADLCLEIRNARRNKGLMNDAYPVEAKAVADVDAGQYEAEAAVDYEAGIGLLGRINTAATEDELEHIWESCSDVWTDEHTAAVKARLAELEAQPVTGPTDLLTEQEIETEVPLQVRKLGLIASLRHAKTEAVMEKIWEQNQDIWCREADQMVKAKLAEFAAVPG
jgi:hypothetical protein